MNTILRRARRNPFLNQVFSVLHPLLRELRAFLLRSQSLLKSGLFGPGFSSCIKQDSFPSQSLLKSGLFGLRGEGGNHAARSRPSQSLLKSGLFGLQKTGRLYALVNIPHRRNPFLNQVFSVKVSLAAIYPPHTPSQSLLKSGLFGQWHRIVLFNKLAEVVAIPS